jgi:hypothetical protein
VKSYLKCGRAFRIETVINDTGDHPWWTVGGPRPCGSATLGSWPWPAPCAPSCTPSPGSPTGAFAPR